MKRNLLYILILSLLPACQSPGNKDTLASLRKKEIVIREEKIEGGLDKAMESYQRFLEDTPDNALAPEAIRRLADLKIEKEYGTITEAGSPTGTEKSDRNHSELSTPARVFMPDDKENRQSNDFTENQQNRESEKEFETRAADSIPVTQTSLEGIRPVEPVDDLEKAGALEAITLYERLLKQYPLYDRNDQVLYQMSRAYEELGKIDEAMAVMERMVREYPASHYIDEVQFRRAEYFFVHKRYLDAEDAYKKIVDMGKGSSFYELALYKLGWTFYKQELYDEAQHRFIALLDHKVSIGYDFEQTEDEAERKRMDDTFRVISLGFSNLGGADTVVAYFSKYGKRSYEDGVYNNLAEFYFDKRRYADATATYNAFVERNPFHKKSPNFHMRVIEIHTAGGFPSLVLDAKKAFASTYGLSSEYWKHFDPASRSDVLGNLKTNLVDLAHHYHSSYQKPHKNEEKPLHFTEALHWYREFLASFPEENESPSINYQMAELLLENNNFGEAAVEYEKTAYDYPAHEKSSEAGYAAVYALRKKLETLTEEEKETVRQDVVRISLRFVDSFPEHEKAAIVLGAAGEDLYAMKEYEKAFIAGNRLITDYPYTEKKILITAWIISAHSAYELRRYKEAEDAYAGLLALLPQDDERRAGFADNLAASVYKQGEQANEVQDYRAAADNFLRVSQVAPGSGIAAAAEFDGATALIQLEDWDMAATVLNNFRSSFPGHELQPEVTKKIAYVYKESGKLSLAAGEYERIETETSDDEVRRDALQIAADLYSQDENLVNAIEVYRRYVEYFPLPFELNIETRNKIAEILKKQDDMPAYYKELEKMVESETSAVNDRTPRTRYLAGKAALVLAQVTFDKFVEIKLVEPFETNLRSKKDLMKNTISQFNRLMDYETGEITAAATYYLAEIYGNFSISLMDSERPGNLDELELEQYELALEEQAYPFEEKSIEAHESNLQLISRGVYNEWVDKSL
ncbi:MAG: tetratricopeptide repeat protein, partial [Deltaproteobacteria bacterium]|nr:tetratricopeptide repeat protein [Deltaproteobacteria bacterium]